MPKLYQSALCLIALSSLVSACGGGETGPTAFTSFRELPASGETQLKGRGASAGWSLNAQTGDVEIQNLQSNQSATANVTTKDGDITAVALSTSGSNVSFDENDSIFETPVVMGLESADRNDAAIIVAPDGSGLEYQSFGIWLTGQNAYSGDVGTGSVGNRTDDANVPANQAATYRGISLGFARRGNRDGYMTTSQVTVSTTDFQTMNITSSSTFGTNIITDTDGQLSDLDFAGTATLSGSEFSGTITGDAVNGNVQGDLFGPNAEEVGGTFVSTSGETVYVGSFGAER